MAGTGSSERSPGAGSSAFERVVCGIDGSDEALEAARQAGRLARQALVLLAAVDPWDLLLAGPASRYADDTVQGLAAEQHRAAAAAALERAHHEIKPQPGCALESRLVEDRPADALLGEADRIAATLIALGPSGRGRLPGIALGSVATAVVHTARCAVLVARRPPAPRSFPSIIVVGVDGSTESELACAVAYELRERYGSEIRPIVARGGKSVDLEAVQRILGDIPFRVDKSRPANALRSASADADLVIVGSRGLHGARSLGSVSERIAHQARSSVLVVREVSVDGT
jgi:nucleotide-binding universal stress UspA family protein